jgi:general secretion pathway protein D
MTRIAAIIACCAVLAACGTQPVAPSPAHIKEAPQATGSIPETVRQSASLQPPKATPKVETYSVTVYKVPVQSLLFALARDAKMNVDIHPGIQGEVTLNALNQTLPQLLTRISKQVDMRYEVDGPNLIVTPDTPFLRNYKIDYVNISRETNSKVSIATQISTTGTAGTAGAGGSGDNNSTTSVANKSNNQFWATLERNIKDILKETDKLVVKSRSESTDQKQAGGTAAPASTTPQPAGTPATTTQQQSANQQVSETERAAAVIVSAETGLIAVRATGRQHDKIQEFLDMVMSSAKRQVLIEATVIEVQLNDKYQQGINWSSLRTGTSGPSLTQGQVGSAGLPSAVSPGSSSGLFVFNYLNPLTKLGNISATIQLLESFGKVKVLSSPKISVLNNQTALLKVVDNNVFFTIKVTPAVIVNGVVTTPATYESHLETVPVGFVMSVTPQIADSDEVTINVRPSISRIIGYVQDPNPALAQASVVSNVPVIQTREMESILKVTSGQIAVMGGLMQDTLTNLKDEVPGASRIPLLKDALAYRNETTTKSELVIFMRPIVVKDASVNGDYKNYRYLLPNDAPLNEEPYTESSSASEAERKRAAGS